MVKSVREWSVCCLVLLLASVPPVWPSAVGAEEPDEPESVVQAEEVVISATKTPVPVTQVTSAVEVITAQDMKRQNIRHLADALRLAQGLAVFSSGGPGTEVNARIRGGSSSQTLVLIDGAIVNGSWKLVGWVSGLVRWAQSGYLYHYAFAMILGLIALLGAFVWIG